MGNENNKKLYRRWLLEMWNGDVGLAPELVASGFLIHFGGVKPEEFRGPEGIARMIRMSRAPFSDLRFTIAAGPITEGDLVSARWTGRGVYAGGFPGATAEPGTQVKFSGTDLLRVESGKFIEYWVSSDGLHLMEQLGVTALQRDPARKQ